MENQESKSVTAQLINDLAAAVILSDICPACSKAFRDNANLVLLKVLVQRGDKVYPYIAIELCPKCVEEKDFNRIRKGLNYWLSEGKLEVI